MPISKIVDEELAMLERRDIEIRSDLSLIQFRRKVQKSSYVETEMRRSCDLKRIIGVTKLLH